MNPYSKAWTEVSLAYVAPSNDDLVLLHVLDSYTTINKPVAEDALKMLAHPWHSSEEHDVLALFDKNATIDDKQQIQPIAIKLEEEGDESPIRPTHPAGAIAGYRLENFATANFFKKMYLNSDFLDVELLSGRCILLTRLRWQ